MDHANTGGALKDEAVLRGMLIVLGMLGGVPPQPTAVQARSRRLKRRRATGRRIRAAHGEGRVMCVGLDASGRAA